MKHLLTIRTHLGEIAAKATRGEWLVVGLLAAVGIASAIDPDSQLRQITASLFS